MKKHFGLIYKVTNILNNKIYIGKTKFTLTRRKKEHYKEAFGARQSKQYFHRTLRKYGKLNFKWTILGYCNSEDQLNEAEIICIEFFKSNNRVYGYNMTAGGEGLSNPSKETRKKLSEYRKTQTGWNHTEETKRKMSKAQIGEKNHRFGKKRTKEEIDKQIKTTKKNGSLKGEKNGMYGKGHLISEEKHGMFGKKHTEETRKNLSSIQRRIQNDPELKKKRSKQQKEIWKNEEYQEKMIKIIKENITDEYREKHRQRTLGGKNPRAIKLKRNDTIYDCIKDAAIALGIPAPTLYSRIRRAKEKNKFPEGWSLV